MFAIEGRADIDLGIVQPEPSGIKNRRERIFRCITIEASMGCDFYGELVARSVQVEEEETGRVIGL